MMSLKVLLKNFLLRCLPFYQHCLVWKLRHKKRINVVFIAMSLSMWRYQHLYNLLSKHPRFKVSVLILPNNLYEEIEQKKDEDILVDYFKSKNITYILGRYSQDKYINLRKDLSPDILFYPQPYNGYYTKALSYNSFYDRLLCYYPYAFWMSSGDWSYNQPLHKVAWKLFYPTNLHKQDAKKYCFRKAKNMEIVGYPTADDFLLESHKDIWKKQKYTKKKIIWAPHFTIFSGGEVTHSNFLWMASFMLDLARNYSDVVQFTFKPHPHLYSELCKHKDWGRKRAESYYKMWVEMDNSQLETGDFVDLFMTSDAMIHDSGSFCVEYQYSQKPVMYIAEDFEEQVSSKGEFGQLAMRQQYVGRTKQDIIDFIENVVLKGDDPMKKSREQFVKDYLLPPNGKTVAQNTMDVFLKAFC